MARVDLPLGNAVLIASGTIGLPPAQVSIDTTVSLLFDIIFTWSVAVAGNTIQYLGGPVLLSG